jgi:hypothetical protein
MTDHITDHFGAPLGGAAHVAEVDPIAAAGRAVIATAIRRRQAKELIGPWDTAHARAVDELLRLRAARDGGAR